MLPALLAVVCALLSVSVSAQGDFSLCYKMNGRTSGSLDDPYAIAVQFSGTYSALQTSTASKYTPAGSYVQLLSITSGLRQINTRNGFLVTSNIVGLAPVNTEYFNDNRLYVSNISQWWDADGIVYTLDSPALFPGKISNDKVNVYRSGVYGSVFESESSGTDPNSESLFINGIPTWTANGGQGFSSCDPDDVTVKSQFRPVSGRTVTVTLSYHLQNSVTDPDGHFTIDFTGSFTSTSFGIDDFGDYYTNLQAGTGSRVYCFSGACTTSTVSGVAPVGDFGFVDNKVYGYGPYFSYNGIAYTLSSPVAKPGYPLTSANTTSDVNVYYSKSGLFLEGFGQGGTGPNGGFSTSATSVSVGLSQA